MNATEIKANIRNKGFSCALLAETLDTTPNAISGVINRHTTSKRIATAISKVLDTPIAEVFPDIPAYVEPARVKNKKIREQKSQELAMLLAS
jgi:lambda repressor-like predicted transcriptional regulator